MCVILLPSSLTGLTQLTAITRFSTGQDSCRAKVYLWGLGMSELRDCGDKRS